MIRCHSNKLGFCSDCVVSGKKTFKKKWQICHWCCHFLWKEAQIRAFRERIKDVCQYFSSKMEPQADCNGVSLAVMWHPAEANRWWQNIPSVTPTSIRPAIICHISRIRLQGSWEIQRHSPAGWMNNPSRVSGSNTEPRSSGVMKTEVSTQT